MTILRLLLRPLPFVPIAAAALFAGASSGLLGACGPFTDVAADAFCPLVQEVFYLGITTGTTATTYDPSGNVTRLQMAAFLSRSVDSVLKRGGRRAAINRFWVPQNETVLSVTTVAANPEFLASDGLDVWVPHYGSGSVWRVRGSDGRPLEAWTGAVDAWAALCAFGKIFVSSYESPGKLYMIDPQQPPGGVTTVASNLGNGPAYLAFDGARIWAANSGSPGSVSIVTPGASIPWTVTNLSVGVGSTEPYGVVFDGTSIWVCDATAGTLLRLGSNGTILQTVTVGSYPQAPAFDGTNIWVPNFFSDSISVVRAGSGAVLATLSGNGLNRPTQAAFDGERVLLTNYYGSSVSLWKAADLSAIGTFPTGASTQPVSACSDGINFWISIDSRRIARF